MYETLRSKKDFDRLWKGGRSAYGRSLGIRFAPNNLSSIRTGIIVSLKVSKRSTERNKIRRRIREILRNEIYKKVSGGFDISVIVQPLAKKLDFSGIREELEFIFTKAKLLKNV